jgi:hypothetical protein
MKKMKLLSVALIAISVLSCKKDAEDKAASTQNISNSTAEACSSRWQGQFKQEKPPFADTVSDKKIIFNGYAHVPVPEAYTKQPFLTQLTLKVPTCAVVDADNLTMRLSLMNPTDSIDAIYPYSVYLYLYGSTDTAHVTFAGNTAKFTSIGVGDYVEKNISGLLHVFNGYTIVTLQAKDHLLSAYIKNTLVAQVDYTGTSIGALQKIAIAFKGSGYVDYVKLFNSTTNALVMRENFDIAGKSTDNWY